MGTKSAPAPPNHTSSNSLAMAFLSKEEAAELLHVTVSTLWRWAQTKTGPQRVVIGRRVLYSREIVDLYVAHEQERQSRRAR